MIGGKSLVGTLAAAVAVVGFVVLAGPAQADPTPDEVRAQIDQLYAEAEEANERYNVAAERLAALKQRVEAIHDDQQAQDDELTGVRIELRDAVMRQFYGANLSAVTQVLLSDEPDKFLEGLSTMGAYDDIQSKLSADYDAQVTALTMREQAAQEKLDEIQALTDQLATEKAEIDAKEKAAKELLYSIDPQSRPGSVSRASVRLSGPVIAANQQLQKAIDFALAQVGKPYGYGGTGPNAYDCSGLVQTAFAQAGISLARSVDGQLGAGRAVGESELLPGDLVFFGSSHVGIYLGGGLMVDAGTPRTGVIIRPFYQEPTSFRRLA